MEKLIDILPKKIYDYCFKHHSPDEFGSWGLGVMSINDRKELLQTGAIIHTPSGDMIANDGFCVNSYNRGDVVCIFKGDEFSCKMELEKIKRERPSMNLKIQSYPKSYLEWLNKDKKIEKAKEIDNDGFEQLLKEI